ncbi:MAG: sigma-70 family RNA polymerase sigma factor [Acidimicrobiales bacterium]
MILEADPPPLIEAETTPEVASLEDLWRREYPVLVRLARALVDSTDRAEEIVQEAFARTLRRFDSLTNPGGYLRTSVINGARGELRKREVRRRIRPPALPVSTPAEDEYLADALASLSPKRRIVLVLRFYADMPDHEIAEHLGVRPATVRSLAARGLDDLRKVIER